MREMIGSACAEIRPSAAEQMLRQFEQLSHRAIDLAAGVEEKLGPFTHPSAPAHAGEDRPSNPPWPPYFADLREQYERLNRALNEIESTLGRAGF